MINLVGKFGFEMKVFSHVHKLVEGITNILETDHTRFLSAFKIGFVGLKQVGFCTCNVMEIV